jgi:hypothetical protein
MRLEGSATCLFVAHPSRRAVAGAPQGEVIDYEVALPGPQQAAGFAFSTLGALVP